MTHGDGSTIARRRKVAASLRDLRDEAGRTQDEAAEHLDCPLPRLQQIEAGMAVVRLTEVRSMLDFYNANGEKRKEILGEARRARDQCWWYPYADLIDEAFETQLVLEDDATVLRTYQPNLVPGLLQTERYAWELIETQSDLPLETVRRLASLRTLRQQVLSRDDAPRLDMILDEAVLRRPVGGPAVMREQYRHLTEIAASPGVTIQVLPFETGPHGLRRLRDGNPDGREPRRGRQVPRERARHLPWFGTVRPGRIRRPSPQPRMPSTRRRCSAVPGRPGPWNPA